LAASCRGAALLKTADFLVTESPPLFLGPAGVYLSRRLGAKFVFNISDLWPDSAVQLGFLKPGPVCRLARALEEWCYRRSALITGQSEGIVANISRRFPEKQVKLLPNGVNLDSWQAKPDRTLWRARLGWAPEDFVLGYVGLHGHAQALGQILAAAGLLQRQPRIRFVFFGDGPCKESLMQQAGARGLARVSFYPCQPHDRVPAILAALDAGLVTLARGPVFEGVRPSKLFEVMAAEKPLVLAAGGEARRIALDAGAALVVPPEEPAALAAAIQTLASNASLRGRLSHSGRRFVARHFDRARIAEDFEALLLALRAGGHGAPAAT
jgi:glycosyltransferase involved in cell wall biosynthesis